MKENGQKSLIGVLGGMGPLASSTFIQTIYQMQRGKVEQEAPAFILYSDPRIPDRTENFLKNRDDMVYEHLLPILRKLQSLGVSKIIVCCITSHYLFPELPPDVRRSLLSLVDIIFGALIKSAGKHLLICTTGTWHLQIFQNHPLWEQCKQNVVVPDKQDQQLIHELIYQIKANHAIETIAESFVSILAKYQVDSFIVGCTEIHLLAKHLVFSHGNRKRYSCIDPLLIIAQELAEEWI